MFDLLGIQLRELLAPLRFRCWRSISCTHDEDAHAPARPSNLGASSRTDPGAKRSLFRSGLTGQNLAARPRSRMASLMRRCSAGRLVVIAAVLRDDEVERGERVERGRPSRYRRSRVAAAAMKRRRTRRDTSDSRSEIRHCSPRPGVTERFSQSRGTICRLSRTPPARTSSPIFRRSRGNRRRPEAARYWPSPRPFAQSTGPNPRGSNSTRRQ